MKILIFRDKKTNKIKNYYDWTSDYMDERIKAYNDNEECPTKAELVDLEEDSIAYYFYKNRATRLEDTAENLRDLKNTLEEIADRIDDRLYAFDNLLKEEEDEE